MAHRCSEVVCIRTIMDARRRDSFPPGWMPGTAAPRREDTVPDPTDAAADAAAAVAAVAERLGGRRIDVIRVSYPDMIGVDRVGDVLLGELPAAAGHGL